MEKEGFAPKVAKFSDMYLKYYHDIFVPNIMSEEENQQMQEIFKTPLPIVFRIAKDTPHFDDLCQQTEKHFENLTSKGFKCEKKTSLPPEFGAVYQVDMTESAFRRDESTADFRYWLRNNIKMGYIRRQELVSMIPHHFMQVSKDDVILDMCASPGSKTSQIVESLSQGNGLVIANDIDLKRCYTLLHQVQEIGTSKVLVTCNAAQYLPDFGIKFNKILADVPCSGDGTVRKDSNVASSWKPNNSTAMHGLQRAILKRGLELLKVGGTLVYSTCSMNPIEDEAVIGSVLSEIPGCVEIVDTSSMFPTLKRHSGLTSWPVYTVSKENPNEMLRYELHSDVPDNLKGQVSKTMFPSGVEGLNNCMRFFPHYENSGGFFVTVLKKLKDFDRISGDKPQKPVKEAPFIPLVKNFPELWDEIKDLYGLKDFPSEQLFARNESNAKNVYILCKPCSELVSSIGCQKINVVAGGVNIFTRKDDTIYPSADGAIFITPHATRQIIEVTPEDVKKLLEGGPSGASNKDLSEKAQEAIKNSKQGGCLIQVPGTRFVYGGMIFKASIAVYVKKDIITLELQKLQIAYPDLFPK